MKLLAHHLLLLLMLVSFTGATAAKSPHSRIKGPFTSGPDVTQTCLTCHQEEAEEFIKDVHWTWSTVQHIPARDKKTELGKKAGINNFCIAVPSNWQRCTSCHAGYGWKDATFDFTALENIDCLVCHDTTGLYKKNPTGAGFPAEEVDLEIVVKNVGRTSRRTCGTCHFYGGGGDHVKHGDLDSSLLMPTREYDVHMGKDGPDMACQFCHQTANHKIPGQAMSVSAGEGERIGCIGCHRPAPHQSENLNDHTDAVACQTCHIPVFAKQKPTKVWGDWSKAGEDRKPEKDQFGLETYTKNQGEMRWDKNIVPTYAWYSGKSERYILGDKMTPDRPVALTRPLGSIEDMKAKIFPFKVMEGRQPYDMINNYLAVPKLFEGFWSHFDWNRAISDGMAAAGLKYSGKFGFARTKMYWRINHMVAPGEQALTCSDCHGERGRLDWKSLGYKGDPKEFGGRRKN